MVRSNFLALKRSRYSPATKYVVMAEMVYANVPMEKMISSEVNTIPFGLSSCTSRKPTVLTVIMVI